MFYRMFDLNIEISPRFEYGKNLLKDYEIAFNGEPDIKVKISDNDIRNETKNNPEHSDAYNEMVCIFRVITEKILDFDGIFVHSAVVALDGIGYMFLGQSGVGKSTHAIEWTKYFGDRAVIINGDKPILRCIENEFIAYGNPWCGKEGLGVNDCVKIKSAAFIEQAAINEISDLGKIEVFKKLLNQTVIPKSAKRKLKHYDLIDKLINEISFYNLKCDISKDAVITAYNKMKTI